jgi:ATP-binding protein involved in chromosome partitioning
MLHSAIRQFLSDVEWGELDYLIIDLPPGTGDAQLSLAQSVPLSGGVIVTLPQKSRWKMPAAGWKCSAS